MDKSESMVVLHAAVLATNLQASAMQWHALGTRLVTVMFSVVARHVALGDNDVVFA